MGKLKDMPTEQELMDGLDPNLLWTEHDLITSPLGRGGCVPSRRVSGDGEAWPHYNTPLHRALWKDDFATAKVLLEYGADIDVYNSLGRTPLLEAVWRQKHDVIRFLLEHNANVNNPSREAHVWYEAAIRMVHGKGGQVCLEGALLKKDMRTLEMLLASGADVCPPSLQPWSILDLAILRRDLDAAAAIASLDSSGSPVQDPRNLQTSGLVGPARALLEFFCYEQPVPLQPPKNEELVPLKELYPIYSYARRLAESGESGGVEDLVQSVFRVLEDESGITKLRQRRLETLCSQCRKFQATAAAALRDKVPARFRLKSDQEALQISASDGCQLCALILEELLWDTDRLANNLGQNAVAGWHRSEVYLRVDSLNHPSQTASMWISRASQDVMLGLRFFSELSPPIAEIRDVLDGTMGPHAMQTAKYWLQNCREDDAHCVCRQGHKARQLPRHLVDIGGGEPRLVDGHDAKVYCALSCRRGDFSDIKKDVNSPHAMKPLFRDAIKVARELGFLYIWIEDFCIQDYEDWAHVSAVYANADLTISTFSATKGEELSSDRSRPVLCPVALDLPGAPPSMTLAITPSWLAQGRQILENPALEAACMLQEQLVCPRILWFAPGMLHWECLEGYRLEDAPAERCAIVNYRHMKAMQERRNLRRAVFDILSGSRTEASAFETWTAQVEAFSRRRLESRTERLTAMASLSTGLAAAENNTFIAGAWKGDKLLQSLCWRAQPLEHRNPNMPSWSWASVFSEISYDLIRRSSTETPVSDVRILSFDVVRNSLLSTSAAITIRARVHRKTPLNSIFTGPWAERLLEDWRSANVQIYPDRDFAELGEIYTIDALAFTDRIVERRYTEGPKTIKLLLEPVEGNSFRRVGIASVPGVSSQPEANGRMARWAEQMRAENVTSPYRWLFADEGVEEREIVIV